MKLFSVFFFTVLFIFSGCKKDGDKEVIKIEGFIITDNIGNQYGLVGTAGNDWKILDWSQLSTSEKSYLNFSENIDMSNTAVSALNEPIAYPNPFSSYSQLNFHSTDSVKIKLAVVNSSGQVLKTYAIKMKGNKPIALDFSDMNLYPSGMNLRYYYSYSSASQQNFKAGYGDVKVCRLTGVPYTACF